MVAIITPNMTLLRVGEGPRLLTKGQETELCYHNRVLLAKTTISQ
jgi:hypothetical protein